MAIHKFHKEVRIILRDLLKTVHRPYMLPKKMDVQSFSFYAIVCDRNLELQYNF